MAGESHPPARAGLGSRNLKVDSEPPTAAAARAEPQGPHRGSRPVPTVVVVVSRAWRQVSDTSESVTAGVGLSPHGAKVGATASWFVPHRGIGQLDLQS